MGFRYEKGDREDEWLPKQWRLTTFPVAKEPALGPRDIIGSFFILQYEGLLFLASARHVVERESLALVMPTKEETVIPIPFKTIEEEGVRWIHHPYDIDMSAMLFQTPLTEQLEIRKITEKYWVRQSKLVVGLEVKHLGFPDRVQANYLDGRVAPFPVAMPGEIIGFEGFKMILKTSGAPGASGGPVIVRREGDSPHLIAVAIDSRLFGTPARKFTAVPLNKTIALPISLLLDILESEDMQEQIKLLPKQ